MNSILKIIRKIAKDTPNDQELGEKIRKLLPTYQNEKKTHNQEKRNS